MCNKNQGILFPRVSGERNKEWMNHSVEIFGPLIFGVFEGPEQLPKPGNVIRIISAKKLLPGDAFRTVAPTARADSIENVFSYHLYQNFPNPFNSSTTIPFYLPKHSKVEIEIYNLLGQRVRKLYSGELDQGVHKLEWNGRNDAGIPVASGVYFYTLKSEGYFQARKMVLLR